MPLRMNRDDQVSINLTPLIDIVFLLIIFFMVGTRFSELTEQEKNIELEVPRVSNATALTPAPKKRVINVLKDGQIRLDQRQVTLEELFTELNDVTKQYRQVGVIVRGDANSTYQHVADVIATCKRAEINDLNISVKIAGRSNTPTTHR